MDVLVQAYVSESVAESLLRDSGAYSGSRARERKALSTKGSDVTFSVAAARSSYAKCVGTGTVFESCLSKFTDLV